MKSIRRHLLRWLLAGLSLLWLLAGVAVLWTVRRGLEGRADAELRSLIFPVRMLIARNMGGRPPPGPPGHLLRSTDVNAFDNVDGQLFFEAWDAEGKMAAKSKSLREHELKVTSSITKDPHFIDFQLPTGESARGLVFRLNEPPGPGPGSRWRMMWGPRGDEGHGLGLRVVIARSRKEIDHALALTLAGIVVSGLVVGLSSALLVRYVVRSGLTPLQTLAIHASAIDATTLETRFSKEALPEELHPIADRLNDLMARLESGFERERRFGSDLAHELRTPISELKAMAEVALKWPQSGSTEGYQDVLGIAQRMQSTVEDLLLLARLEKGAKESVHERLELVPLIEEWIAPMRAQAEARGLKFQTDLASEVAIDGDSRLLGIILRNLVSNAVEYAPAHSCIVIQSSLLIPTDPRSFELRISNVAEDLKAEDVTHLFERLWRLDKSRTGSGHSGLGLSIAEASAKAMSLRLSAQLDEHRTLTFRLRK